MVHSRPNPRGPNVTNLGLGFQRLLYDLTSGSEKGHDPRKVAGTRGSRGSTEMREKIRSQSFSVVREETSKQRGTSGSPGLEYKTVVRYKGSKKTGKVSPHKLPGAHSQGKWERRGWVEGRQGVLTYLGSFEGLIL